MSPKTLPPIHFFSGQYGFLSNFFIEPDGSHVEGEFQRAKCLAGDLDAIVSFDGLNPATAKRLGRRIALRPDWEVIKIGVMTDLVRQKFADHPNLAEWLRETGNRQLIEGNRWNDRFWGVCRGQGQNHLGKILMQVRQEILNWSEDPVEE